MSPARIPIRIAREVAEEMGCSQVILMAFDGERTHVVTFGKSATDCEQAAAGGNAIKAVWHWPESTMDWPARTKRDRLAYGERCARRALDGVADKIEHDEKSIAGDQPLNQCDLPAAIRDMDAADYAKEATSPPGES